MVLVGDQAGEDLKDGGHDAKHEGAGKAVQLIREVIGMRRKMP